MPNYDSKSLNRTLRGLAEGSLVPAIGRHLDSKADLIVSELGDTVVAEIPAFSDSGNPDVLPELAQHARQHTDEILRLLRGGLVSDFDFVRRHAERRAAQRFPLEATLHAYRCGHKVFSRWIRDAAEAISHDDARRGAAIVADFAIEYTDAISTIATQAYVSQIRMLADVEGDERTRLMNILLDGYDESDGRVARILRKAGYLDSRQSFCVALAQPVDPTEMQNPARARRLMESMDQTLDGTQARRLVNLRDDRVTIVFSFARRLSGWTRQQTVLAETVARDLLRVGNAVLIGVSNDVPSTSQIPAALREAELALELADASRRVVQFAQIPMRELLLHVARESVIPVLPAWSDQLYDADGSAKGSLVATLRAYADADMNVLRAGKALGVHSNTVYSRLQRINDLTGLDARRFHDLNELLIAADCLPR